MSGALWIRCIFGLAVAFFVTPVILFCLWPRVLRSWFEAGPEGIDAGGLHRCAT